MKSLSGFPGKQLATIHLTNRYTGDARLFFSPNELLLARAPITDGDLVVWDLTTREQRLTIGLGSTHNPFIPNGPGFAPDSDSLVTCSTSELIRWHIPTQSPVWRFSVPASQWGWGVDWLDYSSDGKQVVVILGKESHAIILDTETGKLLDSQTFANSPCEPIGVICKPHTIQVCYLDNSQGYGRRRFVMSDVFSKTVHISIDLNPDDYPILSPTSLLALIYRHSNSGWGEVWNIQELKRMHLQEIPLPFGTEDIAVGLHDRYLAKPIANKTNVSQPGQCTLELWDLIKANRLQSIEQTISCDIRWSAGSPLLAMSNHIQDAKLPLRNVTLFIDPFAAVVCGHCYGHWGYTPETDRLSPSGRWFASVFNTNYPSNQGQEIPAGTIAFTDLSPILPASASTTEALFSRPTTNED